MTKTSWLSAGLAAGLGCLLLAAAPVAAQEPAPPASVPRGTATTIAPTLPPPTGTLDVVRRRGVLRVGVSTFVPWVMNAKSGDLIGFEVDVAKRLADDLGVKAQFVQASFPNLLDDLLADRFDIIVTGMSITPARALVANFSIPVSESYARLLANRAKAAGIRTAAGFDRPEVTIGVRAGAIGEDVARRSFPKATIQPFEDEDAPIEAVLTGKVTAGVGWSPAPEFLLGQGREQALRAARRPAREEPGGLRRAQGRPRPRLLPRRLDQAPPGHRVAGREEEVLVRVVRLGGPALAMRQRVKIVLSAVALLALAAAPERARAQAKGPAFDCAKAQGEVQQLVCKDEGLAALDRKLDEVYKAARAKAANEVPPCSSPSSAAGSRAATSAGRRRPAVPRSSPRPGRPRTCGSASRATTGSASRSSRRSTRLVPREGAGLLRLREQPGQRAGGDLLRDRSADRAPRARRPDGDRLARPRGERREVRGPERRVPDEGPGRDGDVARRRAEVPVEVTPGSRRPRRSRRDPQGRARGGGDQLGHQRRHQRVDARGHGAARAVGGLDRVHGSTPCSASP